MTRLHILLTPLTLAVLAHLLLDSSYWHASFVYQLTTPSLWNSFVPELGLMVSPYLILASGFILLRGYSFRLALGLSLVLSAASVFILGDTGFMGGQLWSPRPKSFEFTPDCRNPTACPKK